VGNKLRKQLGIRGGFKGLEGVSSSKSQKRGDRRGGPPNPVGLVVANIPRDLQTREGGFLRKGNAGRGANTTIAVQKRKFREEKEKINHAEISSRNAASNTHILRRKKGWKESTDQRETRESVSPLISIPPEMKEKLD